MPLDRATIRDLLASADQPWFRLAQADGATSADLHLYGSIGGWFGDIDATDLVQQLAALDVAQINLRVNSPGGDVFDGIAIMNALYRHQARVVATVDGLAASAASVVVMAAERDRHGPRR